MPYLCIISIFGMKILNPFVGFFEQFLIASEIHLTEIYLKVLAVLIL